MNRFGRRTEGFTLLEVLIALAILGLAASCAYRVLQTSLLRFRQLSRENRGQREAAVALALLSRDIRSALVLSERPDTIFAGHPEALGDRLDFSRAVGGSSPDLGVSTVAYFIDEDVRTGERFLQRSVEAGGDAAANARTVEVCRHVARFSVHYFDGESWKDAWGWDATRKKPFAGIRGLPLLVSVDLVLQDAGAGRYEQTCVIPVMTSVLNRSLHV